MKEASQTLWLRLGARLVKKLDRIAKDEKRSRASMLSILVADAIRNREDVPQMQESK